MADETKGEKAKGDAGAGSGGPTGQKSDAKADEEKKQELLTLDQQIEAKKRELLGLGDSIKHLEDTKVETRQQARANATLLEEQGKKIEELKKDDPLLELKQANVRKIFDAVYERFPQLREDVEWEKARVYIPKLDPLDVEGSVKKALTALRGVYFDQELDRAKKDGGAEARAEDVNKNLGSDIGGGSKAAPQPKSAEDQLTDQEKAQAKKMNLTPEQYLKAKNDVAWTR